MTPKRGINKLAAAIAVIIVTTQAIQADLADDGKVGIGEGIALVPKLWDTIQVVRDGKEILAELNDLDEMEAAQLVNQISAALPPEKFGNGAELIERVKAALPKLIQAIQLLRGIDPGALPAEPVAEGGESA